jgi:ketosteroid isomerase-like protein
MTNVEVQGWLDRYVEAWRTYDPAAVGALFADDAEYRYHPWDEPVRGRDAIVRSWIEPDGQASSRDKPGTYEARYEPYAVDGDRAVAVGSSDYLGPDGSIERRYRNVFLLRFDAEGRCRAFTEMFMLEPRATSAAAGEA